MFDEYCVRRMPEITLEVPMALYPHFLEGLMSSKLVEVDTPAGVMNGYVIRVTPTANLISGAKRFCDVTLQPTGAPNGSISNEVTILNSDGFPSLHPNCRSTMGVDWAAQPKEKPVKIRNKFYVAASSVTTHSEQDQDNIVGQVHLEKDPLRKHGGKWTRKDLQSAIDHATAMLEANQTLEHVAISKIVTVVRRKKAPVVVEYLK